MGGNCVKVDSHPRAKNLHDVWDTTIVRRLEHSIDSGRPDNDRPKIWNRYTQARKRSIFGFRDTPDDIAWESNQIARSDIYVALRIPVEPCDPPAAMNYDEPEVDLYSAYMDHADNVAGHQLAKAGFRLASLLNEIWT